LVILQFHTTWGVIPERETLGGLGVGMLLAGSNRGLGWAFGERAIIRQEPPNDACYVAGDNDQGIAEGRNEEGRNGDAASINGRGVGERSSEEAKKGRLSLIGRPGE
jgi:hypothetical protein